MSERIDLYSDAFLAVVAAEGGVNECQDELFRIARVIEGNEELRQTLSDPHIPVAKRQQIVEDLLEGRAGSATIGLVSLAVATGRVNECQDELFRIARVIEGNEELRQTLSDPHIPVAKRQQIVEDLLEGKAGSPTIGLVSLAVATGRVKDLPEIVDGLLARTAARGERVVAEVRSAVELSEDQRRRLAESLKASTGKDVDVIVVIDPSVLGGIVTQIGDTVIDGSVRARLSKLRESF